MKPNLIPYIIGGIAYLLMLVVFVAAIVHYWHESKFDICVLLTVFFAVLSIGPIAISLSIKEEY